MRSSLYVVSLGRIHYFYLRHNAASKRTSIRLRSGVVFSARKRRVSDHGPARQRRDPWGERPGEFEKILRRRLRLEAGT